MRSSSLSDVHAHKALQSSWNEVSIYSQCAAHEWSACSENAAIFTEFSDCTQDTIIFTQPNTNQRTAFLLTK